MSIPPRLRFSSINDYVRFKPFVGSNDPATETEDTLAGDAVGEGLAPLRLMLAYVFSAVYLRRYHRSAIEIRCKEDHVQ